MQRLSDLIQTCGRLGGQHLQVNIANPEMPRTAQRDPEGYSDPVARVTGDGADFVTPDRTTQDHVIAEAGE